MTTRSLKVYSWLGYRYEQRKRDGRGQTYEVVAATSVAHVRRITGATRADLFNIGETANADAIAVAMSAPGVVFWRGIDDRGRWERDESS